MSSSHAAASDAGNVQSGHQAHGNNKTLMLGALGVVFGDIGTSPLYALRECFQAHPDIHLTNSNIYGVLSLIFWSLSIIIALKYVGIVMRADNRGEGGILALSTLLVTASRNWRLWSPVAALGVFGAALLLGDGFLTPAISVLSAMEGLKVASPKFEHFVVPFSVAALVVLFVVQRRGTGAMGRAFGPIMMVWFITLACLGIISIAGTPSILYALNPYYAVQFFIHNGWQGFITLSSVFLAITGGEALYADMGHFGRRPICNAWFMVAMPALVINYFGQGALLMKHPETISNPFYLLAPGWMLPFMIVLATAATVIASQALISGVFSVAHQAINLGYLPRLKVLHSSEEEIGQVYLPSINWLLFAGTVLLVITYGSSGALANAYGIAISSNMVMVSTMLILLMQAVKWRHHRLITGILVVTTLIELCFFSANMMHFFSGGWLPMVIGAGAYLLMSTWHEGRRNLNWTLSTEQVNTREFLQSLSDDPPHRVPGTAVYMTTEASGIPRALTQNMRFNGVLHERNLLFTFSSAEVPTMPAEERVTVQQIAPGIIRVIARFGFMETPNIVSALRAADEKGLEFKPEETTYVVGRENPIITAASGMPIWRKRLFAILGRNAQMAAAHFGVPAHRVVEIGSQVRI